MNKLNIIKYAIVALVAGVGIGAYVISGKPDSALEQAAEALLKTQGIDVDFSSNHELKKDKK